MADTFAAAVASGAGAGADPVDAKRDKPFHIQNQKPKQETPATAENKQPVELCKNLYKCREEGCLFGHFEPTTCTHGADCAYHKKKKCNYIHPGEEGFPEGHNVLKKKPCNYGAKCHNVKCKFEHPEGWSPSPRRELDTTSGQFPTPRGDGVATLQAQNAALQAQNAALQAQIADLQKQNATLQVKIVEHSQTAGTQSAVLLEMMQQMQQMQMQQMQQALSPTPQVAPQTRPTLRESTYLTEGEMDKMYPNP